MSEHETSSHHHHDDQTELEKLFRNSKPWIEENGTVLIYAVAAFMAIAAVYVYMNRTPPAQVEASRDLLLAVTPEEFRDVADAYPGTEIGEWARLRQADRLLDDAVTNMFTNREEGKSLLSQAETAYEQLVGQSGLDDQIRERVLIGLARIAETRCDGGGETTKSAVDAWKRVLNEYENTLVKQHAESRIEELATEKSHAFYTWFQAQNPSPADPGMAPGQPQVPEIPGFEGLDLNIPPADAEAKPTDEMTEPNATAEPAAATEGPTTEPAVEKPAGSESATAPVSTETAQEQPAAPAEKAATEPTEAGSGGGDEAK